MSLLRFLAQLYGLLEAGAPWPAALTEGVMALVPKKATAVGPLDQRPLLGAPAARQQCPEAPRPLRRRLGRARLERLGE